MRQEILLRMYEENEIWYKQMEYFTKEDMQMNPSPKTHEKMISIISHHENKSENHYKILLYTNYHC
jgi:hypothetical protein